MDRTTYGWGLVGTIVAVGAITALFTRELLIVVAAVVFVAGCIITRDLDDRGLYRSVFAIPLVISTGETVLFAGLVLTLLSCTFLVNALPPKNSDLYVFALAAAIVVVCFGTMNLVPVYFQVPLLLLFLAVIALGGYGVAVVHSEILKGKLQGELP